MRFVEVAKLQSVETGKARLVQIEGRAIALYHVDGKLFATEELCPHRAGPLSEGVLMGNEITCPWHGARFNIETGAVLKGPAARALTCFPVKVEGNRVLVGVE